MDADPKRLTLDRVAKLKLSSLLLTANTTVGSLASALGAMTTLLQGAQAKLTAANSLVQTVLMPLADASPAVSSPPPGFSPISLVRFTTSGFTHVKAHSVILKLLII